MACGCRKQVAPRKQPEAKKTEPKKEKTRPSCFECVEKHVGSALALLYETRAGYDHYLFAVGHLAQAEEESQDWPELETYIRRFRKDLQAGFEVDFVGLIARLEEQKISFNVETTETLEEIEEEHIEPAEYVKQVIREHMTEEEREVWEVTENIDRLEHGEKYNALL